MGAFNQAFWIALAACTVTACRPAQRAAEPTPIAAGMASIAGSATSDNATTADPPEAKLSGRPSAPVVPPVVPPVAPLGQPVRLTAPGCCARPFWRADSRALWFIDKPEGGETGFYEVALDAPLMTPALITSTIASLSPDQRWRVALTRERTTLTRLADGAAFDVPAAGRGVSFSPNGERIVWQEGGGPGNAAGGPPADPSNRIFVAAVDGTAAREVTRLANGSLSGWLDDTTLLVRVREGRESDIDQLRTLPLDGGEGREILRSERLRGIALSTDRSWLAYTVSGSTSTGANGLWIAATRAGGAPPRRLDGRFGAFRWRDGRRLVIIPFEMGAASHRLLELDAETGAERALSDPAATPLRIADGDWSLSPDGRHVAYTNAQDDAVWVMALP